MAFDIKNKLWDLFCIVSIIGIWPRYIEPRFLRVSKKIIEIPELPEDLCGLQILHFSDLHYKNRKDSNFLKKIQSSINKLQPQLILFTGDWICQSILEDELELKEFLSSLNAPLGFFSILGNHDYASYVTKNSSGQYDIVRKKKSLFRTVLSKVFNKNSLNKGLPTQDAKAVPLHQDLLKALKNSGVKVLHNENYLLPVNRSFINLVGLGDHWLGRSDISSGFQNIDNNYPTITLVHNPDVYESLLTSPANLVLSGHTHGAQVNLPWLWKKFVGIENYKYKSGLFHQKNKWLHVSRGIGSKTQFRLFSPPEITVLTLQRKL